MLINGQNITNARHIMTDISKIKGLLQTRLHELSDRADAINDDLTEPTDEDWDEAATEAVGDEVLEEVGEVTLEEIVQIKLALSRIESGKYGICTRCENPIPKARLEALPYATNCVTCG